MRSGSNVALKFIPLIWNENFKKFLNSVQPSDNNIYHPLKNRHTLCVCVCVCICTVVQFCPTLFDPWTIACQAPLSREFFMQEYWSRLPFPIPWDLPNPGIKPVSLTPAALAAGFFTTVPPRNPSHTLGHF